MADEASIERYELPELRYGYGDLEPVVSKETLELHHDKHHAAYVKGANKALEDLADLRDEGGYAVLNQVEKDLAFNLSGHVLHSIFWRNMSPQGGGAPDGRLAKAVTDAFGGADTLREQMTHAAIGVQGSGWAALCYEPLGRRLIVEQIHDHQGNLGNGSMPLLVLDMWEHAYYLQYRNEKRRWAEAFWDVVDWSDVAGRFEAAEPINLRVAA